MIFSHAAGVFLIIWSSFIYEQTVQVLHLIVLLGALTSFFAASVGLVQNDLKRVIAYSTASQLGYMTFALGLSNYHAGFYHLTNHAFLCAVLVHIFSSYKTASVVLKRSACVVIQCLFQIIVERNWTVKVQFLLALFRDDSLKVVTWLL